VCAALGSESDATSRDGYREVTVAEARHIVAYWMQNSMPYGGPLSGSGLLSEVAEPFSRVFRRRATSRTPAPRASSGSRRRNTRSTLASLRRMPCTSGWSGSQMRT